MPELNFYGVTNGTTLALRLSRMGENTASSCQLHCLRKITTLWFRICLYTFALLWTLLHPLISVTQLEQHPRKIFFDENALLPHSSPAYKIEEITSLSKKFQRSFTESTSKFKNHVKSVARNKPGSSLIFREHTLSWLNQSLYRIGLQPQIHRFTEIDRRPGQSLSAVGKARQNVYAILQPKGAADRKETVVIIASLTAVSDMIEGNRVQSRSYMQMHPSGVAIGLALMQVLSQAKWLSKTIIFVAVDGGSNRSGWDFGMDLGARAWVNMYVKDRCKHTVPFGLLPNNCDDVDFPSKTFDTTRRAGSIIAAVSLDFRGENIYRRGNLGVYLQGNHGDMANLDLVNIVLSMYEGNITFSRTNTRIEQWMITILKSVIPSMYMKRICVMLQFIYDFVSSTSRGAHSHFLEHSIDSFTLGRRLVEREFEETAPSGIIEVRNLSMILEKIIRCLSNLSEDLHNSFWNYLIISPTVFVAYGEYAWVLVLGSSSLFFSGYSAANSGKLGEGIQFSLQPYMVVAAAFAEGTLAYSMSLFLWHICGGILGWSPRWCVNLWISVVLFGDAFRRMYMDEVQRTVKHRNDWKTVKACVCMFAWGCHGFGIVNYGMWFLSCIFVAPYLITLEPIQAGKTVSLFSYIAHLMFSPLTVLGYLWYNENLSLYFIEHFVLGTFHLRYVCFFYLPVSTIIFAVRHWF
jgi:hypothetical protein